MGHICNETLVVSGYDTKIVKRVHAEAVRIFKTKDHRLVAKDFSSLISPVILHMSNFGAAFFIAPDGSKEGWDTSNIVEEARNDVIHYIKTMTKYLDWALIELGGDDDRFRIIKRPSRTHRK